MHRLRGGPEQVGIAAAPVGHVLHRGGADVQAERGEYDVGDAVGLGLPLPAGNIAAVFVVAADVPGGLARIRTRSAASRSLFTHTVRVA